jgi:hypothetical protein
MSTETICKLRRVDKREARKVWNAGGQLSISLDAPTEPIGTESERPMQSTNPQTRQRTGWSFDELVHETMQWQHRYPGSQGIVWHEVQA